MSKRIIAPYYTEERIGLKGLYHKTRLPNGYLYSRGQYKTKITAEDLPRHFVYGWVYKVMGYVSVKGIKDIVYKPNYYTNHLHRDDILFVSYDMPITTKENRFGSLDYFDYDVLLWGPMIVDFIRAIRKLKSYDIESIAKEVKNKEDYFKTKYPEKSQQPGIDWLE